MNKCGVFLSEVNLIAIQANDVELKIWKQEEKVVDEGREAVPVS